MGEFNPQPVSKLNSWLRMSGIEIYQTHDSHTQIEVKFEGDAVWLSQQQPGYVI